MSFGLLVSVYLGLLVVLFLLHWLRISRFRSPYIMYVAFLWFFSTLVGGALGYKLTLQGSSLYYSTAIYTLIFVAIMMVYVCEGVTEAQNLIVVSFLSQLLMAGVQLFFVNSVDSFASGDLAAFTRTFFSLRGDRFLISVFAAVVSLFFAVFFFQWLVNRLPKWSRRLPLHFLLLFFSLAVTMVLDTLLYRGLTYGLSWKFAQRVPPDLAWKSALACIVALPLAGYTWVFRKKSHADLKRGTFDIFHKIEDLEQDLEQANQELREYATKLEEKVEERTAEIKRQNTLMAMEMKMAADVQQATLPELTKIQEVDFSVTYIPCSDVSGDLYDFGKLNNGDTYYFLADISGHGVPSAFIGAMCKMTFLEKCTYYSDPSRILTQLAEGLQPVIGAHFITSFLVTVSHAERRLLYVNSGHVPALLVTPKPQIVMLEPTGTIIGQDIFENFKQTRITYPRGTRLVLYTDCVTEHKNSAREEWGMERLEQAVLATMKQGPQEAAEHILQQITAWGGDNSFSDDLSMLVINLP